MSLSFAHIQHAWRVQDPSLVAMLCTLAIQPDATPKSSIADDALTFERFLHKIFSETFREQTAEIQFAQRLAMMATLEADTGNYPLPDRYKIHLILIALWDACANNEPHKSAYTRVLLKQAITELPLSYGVWRGLKYIYKQAEWLQDYEIFGQIAAKIDMGRFDKSAPTPVSVPTKTYMSLRAWRYLRKLGQQLPIAYLDAVVHVLASYDEALQVGSPEQTQSWLLNHICFHHSLGYGVNRFTHHTPKRLFNAKGRAFAEAWQRDAKPLLKLLIIAKNEAVKQFATDSLKHDFQTQLRDVSAAQIQAISAGDAHSQACDEMLVWLLETSPNFEKSKFREAGLHSVVLRLLHAEYPAAHQYAIHYAKSYAQDLPQSELMLLALSPFEAVRKFAMDNILSRDPVKDIGVAGWGQLLDTTYHHAIASKQLHSHFSRSVLTPEWFFERLVSARQHSVDFAIKRLLDCYSAKALGANYFIQIAYQLDSSLKPNQHRSASRSMDFVLQTLRGLDLSAVDGVVWQYLLLHPLAKDTLIDFLDEDLIAANKLDMRYWQALAFEPDWHANAFAPYLQQILSANQTVDVVSHWQKQLQFDDELSLMVLDWLADVRRFAATQLGFDWLIGLAHHEQSRYREFAIGRINKGFLPADFVAYFANSTSIATASLDDKTKTDKASDAATITVDLENQTFLFTGKMQSMTRGEAEKQLKNAKGLVSRAVNGKLDYLVIGDEGSPLYGQGRKGSKQLKAESLIAAGSALKIISETAFLQMLTGQSRDVSTDATLAGAEALWQMATADATAPISELAIHYLSHHHQHIGMALTDRPVDFDAVIPASFFSAERILPLLQNRHSRLRDFGLLVTEYELASWQPTAELWLIMAESNHPATIQLLKRALLAESTVSNHRHHIPATQLNADMLDAFMMSKKSTARQMGIILLQRHRHFQNTTHLYRLTQSTHRDVRYAAVSLLWQHYKARHTPIHWQPLNDTAINAADKPSKLTPADFLADMPADEHQLLQLLRQSLFEIPPARLGSSPAQQSKRHTDNHHKNQQKLKIAQNSDYSTPRVISSSRAKLTLIETFRDVGLANPDFAALITPLLYTFTHSAGKMERHACLVAITRLLTRYPKLAQHLQPITPEPITTE